MLKPVYRYPLSEIGYITQKVMFYDLGNLKLPAPRLKTYSAEVAST